MTIVDENGQPVWPVQLTRDSGIVCYTNSRGNVSWGESSIMNRKVHFKIKDRRYQFQGGGIALRILHGGHATVTVYDVAPE